MKRLFSTKMVGLRFFRLFVIPNFAFAAIMLLAPPDWIISQFNSIIVALAFGVCVAYFPVIWAILLETKPVDRADILALGIFCSWFGILIQRGWSIVWRWSGQPMNWTDSRFIAYALFLAICGAGFHLAAPGAIGDRVPTREWIKIGVITALGIITMMVMGWLLNLFD